MTPSPASRVVLRRAGDIVEAEAVSYRWSWSTVTDEVTLRDHDGRRILVHRLQPAVAVSGEGVLGARGSCVSAQADGARLDVRYEHVNGGGAIRLTLRFLPEYYVLDTVVYEPAGAEAITGIAYLGDWAGGVVEPNAVADTCVIPCGRQDPEQAIFRTADLHGVRFSVGCSRMDSGTSHQQWALPHYLVACYNHADAAQSASGAACIGLGGIPDGNVTVRVDQGRFSYEINFRGDLWGHRRGPATQRFDFPLVTAVAGDWYEAGLGYFEALVAEGCVHKKRREEVPAAACWPQYDTWGDQAAHRCICEFFDEAHLRHIYRDFRASGLRSRLFVIDDKWERVYGSLEHDNVRFPHFRELLDEIRGEGHEIGLWSAFPRCGDYRALGLSEAAVLIQPDGAPYVVHEGARSWYLFDPTNAEAAAYLAERARRLARTYRPALVKFDFGYDIPTPDVAGPHDPSQGGERLFLRFLEVIVGALKAADPQVAVLYYCLTPLFSSYLDQCGMDDLWMSHGAYDSGFAKRALLSSWCGSFGVVPYGSSGYDWRSAPEIWLDSSIIGTPGVIAPLAGDEYGQRPTPDQVARYNGVARVTRHNPFYRVEFFDADLGNPEGGPRACSWARIEGGEAVVVALRPATGAATVAPGLVEADCRVVVASLTADGIRTTTALGIVPFGSGRVRVQRSGGGPRRALAHLLGGETTPVDGRFEGEQLSLEVMTTTPGGAPVELIEVRFD